jgi:hypothetical protein
MLGGDTQYSPMSSSAEQRFVRSQDSQSIHCDIVS